MRFSLAAASQWLSKLLPHAAPVTWAITGFCVLLYGASLLMTFQRNGGFAGPVGGLSGLISSLGGISNAILLRMGESLPLPYLARQPWRMVMAIFLHGSLIHVGFNMMTLLNIGPLVEEMYGSAKYLFLFIVTGAIGYVASAAFGNISVGASGSLLGLVGAIIAVTGARQSAGARMIRNQLLTWVIGIAILGFLMPVIDNYAHAGGFAAGYVLGKMMPDRPPADTQERRRAELLGWLAGGVAAVCFALMLMNYFATAPGPG